jgi:hypothetical protein
MMGYCLSNKNENAIVPKTEKFSELRGCLGLLCSTFFSSAPRFLAKRFQLHALSSRKKSWVVRAPKEVLHELQFFVKLLPNGVYGAEFVEQSQTPSKQDLS